jgi:drug/metabolite transporter (DMT)-like permease
MTAPAWQAILQTTTAPHGCARAKRRLSTLVAVPNDASVLIQRTTRRSELFKPAAAGVALAAVGGYVALNDPSAPGSRFPACAFHSLTGLWCPGCGLTRGTHHLLNGDLPAALSYNVFTPIAVVAIAFTWLAWASTASGRPMRSLNDVLPRWWGGALASVLVAYGIARNLPISGLRALAP